MKIKISIGTLVTALAFLLFFYSCKKDPQILNTKGGFPTEVQRIFENKCATAGCHNDKSFQNAAGLNLTSWSNLVYKGGVSGSVVIPFRPEFSSLFQFINSYEDLGLSAEPQMPINGDKLTREEVLTIKSWIEDGCKNDQGEIPFDYDFTTRKKVFISNQGCDVVAIIDDKTKLIMRYITIGKTDAIETPHFLDMSGDGRFWYACFTAGEVVQKFETSTGKMVGEVQLGEGAWNVIKLTDDGNTAYVSDLSGGRIAKINTQTMSLDFMYANNPKLFDAPHGIEISATGDTLYVTSQFGNTFYRFIPGAFRNDAISLVKGQAPNFASNTYDPHEVIFSPDRSKYFFTCQSSNEVRVFDASADTLLKVIPVGKFPLEFAISESKNLLFVSCSEEPNPTFPILKGSVDVIDMGTLENVKTLFGKFFQPHGMIVNDASDELYVASRNAESSGPPPHHVSECGSRNGYFEVFDINTWEQTVSPQELSVDPYAVIISK
jgi:DNA-binding beta-propeller fold protein YncE